MGMERAAGRGKRQDLTPISEDKGSKKAQAKRAK